VVVVVVVEVVVVVVVLLLVFLLLLIIIIVVFEVILVKMLKLQILLSLVSILLTICKCNNEYYYKNWCGSGLQYLDDSQCAKVFPTTNNRDMSCNTNILDGSNSNDNDKILSLLKNDYYYDIQKLSDVNVDVNTLSSIVTSDANVCVILTKRIKNYNNNDNKIELLNKYYCAGNHSRDDAWETWSSSKIFAMANGAGRLRSNETTCINDMFGMNSNTTGKNGVTPVGDLATIICSYDHTKGYSSNSLASYFHDLGWRQRLNDLINSDWIGTSPGQSLGGNYGEATPSDLALKLNYFDSYCNADKDPWPNVYSNTISSLTAAELTRRLALHKEIKSSLRFPGLLDTDAINILNGEEKSIFFPNQVNGGMSADTAIFVQSSLKNVDLINSNEDWRIFSKLGDGFSTSRERGEIVNNAYVCLPQMDQGIEFTINVRGSVINDYDTSQAESKVLEAMKQTIGAILKGLLY